MQSRGYSLIEMLLVIGIVSILLAIGTLRFNEYMRRYKIETQTRTIYYKVLEARAAALYERRSTRLKLYARRLELYSSARDNTDGVKPVLTQALDFPITCNGHGDGVNGYRLDFDAKGLAGNSCSISLEAGEVSGAVDSVIISRTRVRIGKKDQGDESDP